MAVMNSELAVMMRWGQSHYTPVLAMQPFLQRALVYKTQDYVKAVNQSLTFPFLKWKTEIPIPLLGPSKEGFK